MSTYPMTLRHPLEHPAATVCTIAVGLAGQLLLTRALAKVADLAEQAELQPARGRPVGSA